MYRGKIKTFHINRCVTQDRIWLISIPMLSSNIHEKQALGCPRREDEIWVIPIKVWIASEKKLGWVSPGQKPILISKSAWRKSLWSSPVHNLIDFNQKWNQVHLGQFERRLNWLLSTSAFSNESWNSHYQFKNNWALEVLAAYNQQHHQVSSQVKIH